MLVFNRCNQPVFPGSRIIIILPYEKLGPDSVTAVTAGNSDDTVRNSFTFLNVQVFNKD